MTAPADDADLGTLEEADGRSVVRFERTYPHSVERVWAALTDPDELAHWFPTTIDGERARGAALRFEFRFDAAPDGFGGTVDEYDPPHVFAFHWGADALRWELHPIDGGCRLVLTDAFDTIHKAARDSAGWHLCLAHLADLFAGGSPTAPTDEIGPRWQGLFDRYADRFPPEASTLTDADL